MTLELDYFQGILKVQSALGSLMVHRISHITMLITLCCTLPQHLSQEIHCCKLFSLLLRSHTKNENDLLSSNRDSESTCQSAQEQRDHNSQ